MILVLGVVLADLAFFRLASPSTAPDPQFIQDDLIADAGAGAFVSSAGPVEEIDQEGTYENFAGFVLVERGSLSATGSTLASETPSEEDILTYTVKDGDTLSSIAKEFGLSVGDVLEANDKGSSLIRPGEELAIVPVSKSGGVLRVANDPAPSAPPPSASYFIRPVDGGLNWGEVHDSRYMPAVDISKACGAPIYAAASGTVTKVASPTYYNSGYGGYVIITHPNGTRTMYAHNSANVVETGDEVQQGEQIASVGNSGLTYGSTGCHVHFGVSGAANPFIR
ncbi:MAG: peptidoglycan DD-metalloendopeptidase family protein [Candidatus Colwellbacteria bacterium]